MQGQFSTVLMMVARETLKADTSSACSDANRCVATDKVAWRQLIANVCTWLGSAALGKQHAQFVVGII